MYRKFAVALLTALPALAGAAAPGTHQNPLPTKDCLAPATTWDWDRIDDTHVVFEGLGRRRFMVETATLCTELMRVGATIAIDAGPVNRLCGRFGEYLVVGQQRCRVRSVTPLSKEEYRRWRSGELKVERTSRNAAGR